MPPAIIAAGIGAAASIGGGLLASSGQKKAAKTAAQTEQNVADTNNALQGQIYNSNVALADPWRTGGLSAFNATNALLGLGGGTGAPQPPAQAQYGAPGYPSGQNALAAPGGYGIGGGYGGDQFTGADLSPDLWGGGRFSLPSPMSAENSYSPQPYGAPQPFDGQQPYTATTGPAQQPNALSPQGAFQNFLNSDGYQFRFGQGQKAIDMSAAAHGTLNSGATLKALQRYGQGIGSEEFGKYLGYLGNQQQVGLGATNAVMGVGTNYANQVSQNNNNAGDAAANAALARGNANANMWSGIAGGVGNALGAINFGSSYKKQPAPADYIRGSFGGGY